MLGTFALPTAIIWKSSISTCLKTYVGKHVPWCVRLNSRITRLLPWMSYKSTKGSEFCRGVSTVKSVSYNWNIILGFYYKKAPSFFEKSLHIILIELCNICFYKYMLDLACSCSVPNRKKNFFDINYFSLDSRLDRWHRTGFPRLSYR